MEKNAKPSLKSDESFRMGVPFLRQSGRPVPEGATELRLKSAVLRTWNRKSSSTHLLKTVAPLDRVSQLQAENQALQAEIHQLKGQWSVLKTTLGILSSSVCQQENHA